MGPLPVSPLQIDITIGDIFSIALILLFVLGLLSTFAGLFVGLENFPLNFICYMLGMLSFWVLAAMLPLTDIAVPSIAYIFLFVGFVDMTLIFAASLKQWKIRKEEKWSF